MVINMSAVFSALSDNTRLDILFRLTPQRLTVGEIACEYKVSQPAITKHLNVLEKAGLITRERRGRQHVICPATDALSETTAFMNRYESLLGNRLSAIETYLRKDAVPVNGLQPPSSTHQTIKLVQYIAFSRKDVWAAYTDAEQIPHWWAPPGSTLIDCQVEAREGGVWRFTLRSPGGQTQVVSGIFMTVSNERKLVYTDGFGDPHEQRAESLVTVTFEDSPQGGTILTKELVLHHQLQGAYMDAIKTKEAHEVTNK